MNLNTLQGFRQEVYGCFDRAADALFNSVDALLTETQAHSFPELSLSPAYERCLCSLSESFEDGQIVQRRLSLVFVRYLLRSADEERVWLGIDATSIERPQSKTSPDRTVVYKPNLPESSKPISYGWQFSTVVLLPEQPSRWTAVLDQQGIRSEQTSVEVAAAQLRQLAPLLECRPIVAAIAGTVVRRFCWRRKGCLSTSCCASNASACCTAGRLRPQANAGRRAKMGRAFSAAIRGPMDQPMAVGKALMPTDMPLRSAGGRGCICPRHDILR